MSRWDLLLQLLVAFFGTIAGVLFGFKAAAMKTFDTAVLRGFTSVLTSWSSYALLVSAARRITS